MTDKLLLVPTDPDKVVPDIQGKRIGPEGTKVRKPLHPYYTRRIMRGDLAVESESPKVYEPQGEED